ncbi:MAG TPA: hypothetical protein PKW66_12705, partial [Polyangiaceae bacterium]|nr:hypothetical protein [Polyangiaceae bacterium]
MKQRLASRDLAYCGLFGAAALLLPILFHAVHLGHVFMPMYLPLVCLGFFARPVPTAVTALLSPLLSAAIFGMPPFFPPVASSMALELATMAGLIAWLKQRWPNANEWLILVPVLLLGRVLYVVFVYATALLIELPPKFMAGLSLLGGWPGLILMVI